MTLLVWLLLWLPLALLVAYPLAIQYERGGKWRVLLPLYLAAGVVDVLLNYTTLVLYTWDRPLAGEYTFSRRLKRLQLRAGWRQPLYQWLQRFLDYFDPQGSH